MDTLAYTSGDLTQQQVEMPEIAVPLAVDLDGTIIRTDCLLESCLVLFKANPFIPVLFLIWLARGKAFLKQQIARRVALDISSLPYNLDVLSFLQQQRRSGRTLILATGTDERIARQIFDYLHVFDKIFASDGKTNLSPREKRKQLISEYGVGGFAYLGNGWQDLVVWQAAGRSIIVGSKQLIERVQPRLSNIETTFEIPSARWPEWIRTLRIHHWLKNLLVFVPLVAAHRLDETGLVLSAVTAFLSFGFCASSVYVLNDLLDLPEDRKHPRKRFRPLASGVLPLSAGLVAVPILLGLSITIGLTLPFSFLIMLAIYYTSTLAYSFRLKKVVILDVIVLATLFTVRMMAGSAAVAVWPSSWLLAHSMFLFVSLALVKRYAELMTMKIEHGQAAKARSYVANDASLLATMGIASAFVSVLVLAMYITSGEAHLLYSHYQVIWLACPVLLYWLCYMWLTAHRGGMHDDPMVFAMKDKTSRSILITLLVIMFFANWPV